MATGEVVTVACKLPAGLIIDVREPPVIMNTPHGEALISGRVLKSVKLNGSAAQRRMESNGQVLGEHPMVAGGYGLTENVSKDFFDKWLAENRDYPPVAAGAVFALPKIESVRSKAKEQGSDIKSGFEPLDRKAIKEMGVKIEPLNNKDD